MKILSLDLSTKSGWSIIDNGKLICYGLVVSKIEGDSFSNDYPHNYIRAAKQMAVDLKEIAIKNKPDYIVIEETNKGKNRFSQKCLEFIHYAINESFGCKVHYIDTSEWRSLLEISLDKEQRSDNKEIKQARDEMFNQIYNDECSHYKPILDFKLASLIKKREITKAQKTFNIEMIQRTKIRMRSFRFKVEGKVKGKIDAKTLSVNYVNEYFNLNFKKKDNDVADSICLGLAFIKKLEKKNE